MNAPTREQMQVLYDYADLKISAETALDRLHTLFSQPSPSEVLVEGSYFPTADLPDILGRHMRALDGASRREKQHWIERHEPSPSTPSVEPMWFDRFGRDGGQWVGNPVERVRIEDMAPGTTFTAQFHGEWDRFFRCRDSVARAGRYLVAMDAIDPSTVRDVTPPPPLPRQEP